MSIQAMNAFRKHTQFVKPDDVYAYRIGEAICDKANSDGVCGIAGNPKKCLSVRGIAKLARVHYNTVSKYVNTLIESGEFSKETGGTGRGSWTVYKLNLPMDDIVQGQDCQPYKTGIVREKPIETFSIWGYLKSKVLSRFTGSNCIICNTPTNSRHYLESNSKLVPCHDHHELSGLDCKSVLMSRNGKMNRWSKPKAYYNYDSYIASAEWKIKADTIKRRNGWQCERCNIKPKNRSNLHAHHKNYETLYHETPGDLEVLCSNCHELEHE